MPTDSLPPIGTAFASPERSSAEAIEAQHRRLAHEPMLAQLLECIPEPAMAVNAHRQIVLVNSRLASLLHTSVEALLGQRPGEALMCLHVPGNPAGCGTGESCRYCGAVNALVRCLDSGERTSEECRITRRVEGELSAMDLRVWASPISIGQSRFAIFVAQDITDDKRRRVLERIFFHDAMNVVGGLQGLTDLLLEDCEAGESRALIEEIHGLALQLVEEMRSQRDLAAAESGELAVTIGAHDVAELIRQVASAYAHHTVGIGKRVEVKGISGATRIFTDGVLLRRVLGNLLKNALEASEPGDCVQIGYDGQDEPVFFVANPAVMPVAVQRQLFQRSFSTKGEPGRGIGLYSVRLLTERYLRGRVAFESDTEHGTRFSVRLPASALEKRP